MDARAAFAFAMERLHDRPLIYASADADEVQAAQARHGRHVVAGAIEGLMAQLATMLIDAGVARLVVGGGETSGAVVTALGVAAFAIGPEIDPGVPALSVEGRALNLALKSGNFGAADFFDKAMAVLGDPS